MTRKDNQAHVLNSHLCMRHAAMSLMNESCRNVSRERIMLQSRMRHVHVATSPKNAWRLYSQEWRAV